MPRVRPSASPNRLTRRSSVGLAFTGAILVVLVATGVAQAVAVTVGFRDFAYDPGQASRATSAVPAADSPRLTGRSSR